MALHTAKSKLCPLNVTSCGLSCPILSTKPLINLASGRWARSSSKNFVGTYQTFEVI